MSRTCTQRRGRSIAEATARALFGQAAGFCQKPECNRDVLIKVASGRYVSVGEMAHVVAASEEGPRADVTVSNAQLTDLDNLILLCSVCHTLIDKAPDDYPTEIVMGWKRQHLLRRRTLMAVRECSTRDELRRELDRYLDHNAAIHALCSPDSPAADDPISDAFDIWQREVTESLIPNNRKIVELLQVNAGLLTEEERRTASAFRVHADAFEARHLFNERSASVPRFPDGMNALAKDVGSAQRRPSA